jgi:O-antigen/teichoic acid export membrane protein
MRVIAAVLLPVLVTGIVFSRELLGVWLGSALAHQAAPSLRWLLVGVLFNALAHIPYARLQGEGAADLTAKAHLVELPIYALLLAVLLRQFGVVGAAMAWSARVTLDFAILDVAAQRRGAPSAHGTTVLGGAAVLLALVLAPSPSLALRGGLVALVAIGAAAALWALGARERFTSFLGARAGAGGRA